MARVLLLVCALTARLYSQSLPLTSQLPVLRGFEPGARQNEACHSRLSNPRYAWIPKAQAPRLFRGLGVPSSRHSPRNGSSGCYPFTAKDLEGNSARLRNKDSWARVFRRLELPDFTAADGSQSQSAPKPPPSSVEKGSPGHIFWVVPAYKVEYLKDVKPLTPRQKFDEWARGAYDPLGLASSAAEAGLEHSPSGGFCGYGGGVKGYGECFGSALLDANVSSVIGDFLLPVLLHQDPRYFALGQGSAGTRILYAVSRVFLTRTDSGSTTLDSSALSGTLIAAAASNLYYPRQDRGFGLTLSRIGWDLGDTAIFNVAAEYWPDIHHGLHRVF